MFQGIGRQINWEILSAISHFVTHLLSSASDKYNERFVIFIVNDQSRSDRSLERERRDQKEWRSIGEADLDMISSNNRNSIKRCFANEMRIRDPTSNDFMCPLCPITMQCSNPSPSPLLFTEPNGSAKQRLAWNSWQRLAITRHSRDYTEPLLI